MNRYGGKAAVFDVDDSLVAGNSGTIFTWQLLQANELSARMRTELPRAVLDFARRRVSEEHMVRLGTVCQAGIRADRLRLLARRCLESAIRRRITAAGRAQVQKHLAAGHLVIVASGSSIPIISEVAREVRAHVAIGTRGVIREGVHTDELHGEPIFREGKRRAVLALLEEHGIDPAESWLYSDSAADTPLFERVGHPVVIDPKPAFETEAVRRGWSVRNWKAPAEAADDPGAWASWDG